MPFQIQSEAFEQGSSIPKKFTGEGDDASPPLYWEGAPQATKEFALICDDPDAPTANPFVHWVLYKIPKSTNRLSESTRGKATEGQNDFGNIGYGGPLPPPGDGVHHYHFRLYALDSPVDLNKGASKEEVLQAMKGHVLAESELTGTFERKG